MSDVEKGKYIERRRYIYIYREKEIWSDRRRYGERERIYIYIEREREEIWKERRRYGERERDVERRKYIDIWRERRHGERERDMERKKEIGREEIWREKEGDRERERRDMEG